MTKEATVEKATKNVVHELKSMEASWTTRQKKCLKERILKSMEKKGNRDTTKEVLLKKCKKHGSPASSVEDAKKLGAAIPDPEIVTPY